VLILVLLLSSRPAAQDGNTAWVSWARSHHFPISTLESSPADRFEDLQFFHDVLAGRRIVQLGESGHGVAEFNSAKVRLIKFLHEQMGFDVIAFESGLYQCYSANAAEYTADVTMRNCIFGVWWTAEVIPLFNYIKATQQTDRPLLVAGFDTQTSNLQGNLSRPAFFARLVGAIDPSRAAIVESTDRSHLSGINSPTSREYATAHEAELTEFYGYLERLFHDNRARLTEEFGDEVPRIAERSAWSMLRYFEQLRALLARPGDLVEGGGFIRDRGMADNLTFLANELYRDRKIMVWAHNFHIRHDQAATTSTNTQQTMGKWVAERFRPELYTIGLYMNQGTAANNDRTVYSITPAPTNSMEWVMAGTQSPFLFMDFLHQKSEDGNAWMFQPTFQRDWGTGGFTMVPRDQYDGVLFIDTVRSPSYLY